MIEKDHCLIINAELDTKCHNKSILSQFGVTGIIFKRLLDWFRV